jgi:hypothetical protein
VKKWPDRPVHRKLPKKSGALYSSQERDDSTGGIGLLMQWRKNLYPLIAFHFVINIASRPFAER